MTNEQIIIWMYVVGLLPIYGFTQDVKCVSWVRIPVIFLWPVSVPFALVIGLTLRAWEAWRGA